MLTLTSTICLSITALSLMAALRAFQRKSATRAQLDQWAAQPSARR